MVGFELPRLLAGILDSTPGATEVLLAVGRPPQALVGGALTQVPSAGPDCLTPFHTEAVVLHLLAMAPVSAAARVRDAGAAHFAYSVPGVSRFRVAVFSQRGTFAVALRVIPEQVPTAADLHLPSVLAEACQEPRGVIIVSGTAGSGRSTTMAALVDKLNRSRPCHVVTVEDPIEFLHRHVQATVNQREVGTDTPSLAQGLADALREGTHVVVTSEVSDGEEASMILEAAESGHLAMTIVRGLDSASSIARFLSLFPPDEREEARQRLAGALRWCFTQRLVPHDVGTRPVMEVWRAAPSTVEHLRGRGLDSTPLAEILAAREGAGMVAFDRELEHRVRAGSLAREVAVEHAVQPQELEFRLDANEESEP